MNNYYSLSEKRELGVKISSSPQFSFDRPVLTRSAINSSPDQPQPHLLIIHLPSSGSLSMVTTTLTVSIREKVAYLTEGGEEVEEIKVNYPR